MIDTRPSLPRTGNSVEGCYAAPLQDCGGSLDGEHYISKKLLLRFKKGFTVDGLPWALTPKSVGVPSMTAHVLCQRHNRALSGLDDMIGEFYDFLHEALAPYHPPESARTATFDGEDLERWALKVLCGLAASGNLMISGKPIPALPVTKLFLLLLFGETQMPERCGFKMLMDDRADLDANQLACAVETVEVNGQTGVFGITVRLLGFQYATCLEPIETLRGIPVTHRPDAFMFGDPARGVVQLRWNGVYTPAVRFILGVVPSPSKKGAP